MLITAWWDVNRKFASGHNPRRRRDRPLRELERFLGHKLRTSEYIHHDRLAPDQYQYNAYSWLEADCIDDAVVFTLKQLSRLGLAMQFVATRLNRSAFAADDLDDSTIGSIYWDTELQPPLERIGSGGVLLFVSNLDNRYQRKGRKPQHPIVRVPASAGDCATYDITMEVAMMGDPAHVRSHHWPRYRDANGLERFDVQTSKGRPAPGHPNRLVLKRTLQSVTEIEAICSALECGTYFKLEIGFGDDFKFVGSVTDTKAEGLSGVRVTRHEPILAPAAQGSNIDRNGQIA